MLTGASSARSLTPGKFAVVALDFLRPGSCGARPMSSRRACSRAINSMMLDMLAAVARKDYDDRRRRQVQGIAKAKLEGAYAVGRKIPLATLELLRCCAPVRHGPQFRPRSVAAGPRSPRLPSERLSERCRSLDRRAPALDLGVGLGAVASLA